LNEFKEKILGLLTQYMDIESSILLYNFVITGQVTKEEIISILYCNCDELELKAIIELPSLFGATLTNCAVKALAQHTNNVRNEMCPPNFY